MNKLITNEQIIAMNQLLADYTVRSTELLADNTDLVQYIRLDTPPAVILSAIALATTHGLKCFVIRKSNTLIVTSWHMC